MSNYLLYSIILLSLVGLGIVIYRKIPVLANLSEEEINILSKKKNIMVRLQEIDYKQYWLNFMIGLEKFLRRIKIVFLKIENLLTKCIGFLRNRSQIMTQKSREWIKQREAKKRETKTQLPIETEERIPVKIDSNREKAELDSIKEEKSELEEDDLPISELKKPIKEEQKWIDLIIENPKNITAYKFLGLLYYRQHNYPDAKSSLKIAIKLGCKDKKVKDILKELKGMNIK
ncbi:MAG: hypothetical protein ABIF84_01760 [Patescibacteria group bacterium]